MTSTEQRYADMASEAQSAVERSTELWKQGAVRLSEQAGMVSMLPLPDLDEAFDRYFSYLQRGVEVNRGLAKEWTAAVSTLSGAARSQLEAVSSGIRGHAEAIGDWITGEADTAVHSARKQADAIATAKREQARKRYQDLSKAELTDLLGERDLPKNGTVEELVDRLVDADSY